MSEQYRTMWKDLGLDLAAHDMLLEMLGEGNFWRSWPVPWVLNWMNSDGKP